MNKNTLVFGVLATLLIIGGVVWASSASEDTDVSTDAVTSEVTEEVEERARDFTLDADLEQLAVGYYEGWIVRGDDKFSTGLFNVNDEGALVGDFSLENVDPAPQDGDTFAVTIEPEVDTDPGPSATVVLAGEVTGDAATLAFPVDTSEFTGQYILATPTDGNDDVDETAGVWFLDLSTGSPTVGLNLPDAPDGWIYEGWVVADGTPLSTGKFLSATGADDFNGFSGTEADAPPFPGEDLLQNLPAGIEAPYDIADGETAVVISLEPFQDGVDPTGDGPAQVKPLATTPEAGAADHSTFDFMNDPTTPTGSVAF